MSGNLGGDLIGHNDEKNGRSLRSSLLDKKMAHQHPCVSRKFHSKSHRNIVSSVSARYFKSNRFRLEAGPGAAVSMINLLGTEGY